MTNSITFNSIDLGDYGLTITQTDINRFEKRGDYTRIKDLSITGQSTREPKQIWSKFVVKGSSRAILDGYLDYIKMTLDGNVERTLVFDVLDDRYFLCKLERFDGGYISPYVFQGDVQFMCADPLAYSTTLTSSDHVINADPITVTETTLGSAYIRPIYTLTATAELGAIVLKLENANTTEELQWDDSISDTEVLEIDCENWKVELDGVASMTNISGQFPTLAPSAANSIVVTGVSAATLNIQYRNRYL